jgi:hypothetical protein
LSAFNLGVTFATFLVNNVTTVNADGDAFADDVQIDLGNGDVIFLINAVEGDLSEDNFIL